MSASAIEPPSSPLQQAVLKEWDRAELDPVPEEVRSAATDIAARYGSAVDGVLFYGSCLRTGEIEEKVLDFYIIVENYSLAYDKKWLAIANKMIPPNVFYHEIEIDGMIVRSKYAVISRGDLAQRTRKRCLNVSIWARFCQPCLLLLAKSDIIRQLIAEDIAAAHTTMIGHVLPLSPDIKSSRATWVEAFELTYASELRSERRGKGLELYLLDQQRYDDMYPLVVDALGIDLTAHEKKQPARGPIYKAKWQWFCRRMNGKFVSFMRLLKATATFDGGIDYIAWKIRRHSGVHIDVTDWMRAHPILAGIRLFFKLRNKRAFK